MDADNTDVACIRKVECISKLTGRLCGDCRGIEVIESLVLSGFSFGHRWLLMSTATRRARLRRWPNMPSLRLHVYLQSFSVPTIHTSCLLLQPISVPTKTGSTSPNNRTCTQKTTQKSRLRRRK